jgi:hypothetical protein
MTDFYSQAAAKSPAPSTEGGASGYFSSPSATLDPALFDGDNMHTSIRTWLWERLCDALMAYHLEHVSKWLHAWVAGSAITYQWDADRGNGDLDVLFGVDYPALLRYNPEFRGLSEAQFASELDDWLKTNVWPDTAFTNLGGRTFEVTFYLNPGTETDIRNIHPYAALDIRSGEWVVRPPEVAPDPESMYPKTWFDESQSDTDLTGMLTGRYQALAGQVGTGTAATQRNNEVRLRQVTDTARALLDSIHTGRREAFGPQGNGYSDWHNFRWQAAKRAGTVQALHAIVQAGHQAREAEETALYGGPIAGASEALTRAALVHKTRLQR